MQNEEGLPSGLQSFTFGNDFNQSLDNTTLPSGLQIITLLVHVFVLKLCREHVARA